ncbi:MAG: hypothetical protein ACFE7R_10890 [Candidatus Hodarchaeota archaeon]
MIDLGPALSALRNVTSTLVDVMPDIASELNQVNDNIQDTLTATKFSSEPPIIQTNLKTPGGQEILGEVNAVLEQRLSEQLPEPPAQDIAQEAEPPKQELKEMVALVVGCGEGEPQPESPPEDVLSIEDVTMQSISLKFEKPESLEDKVLDYIKQRKGQLNITDCALELKIPPKEIKKVLKSLDEKGRIILGT